MKNKKTVLSAISIGFITLGTISFASTLYYDSKIDQINEYREAALYKQSATIRYIYRAESNKMEAAIIIDHIDILKKLNASKLLIKEKILFALNRYACAAAHAINGAKMSGEINDAQGNEAIKHTMTLSKSKDIDPIYESYMKKVTAGTKNLAESMDRNKDEINNLRKNKTWFWLIAIGLNSIGGVIAVISSLKENKNNTALSSVTTPVKKENQDGEGRDCRGLIR